MRSILIAAMALTGWVSKSAARPLTVPFAFDRGELAFDAEIDGHPVFVMLDTGVDPSGIDLATAERLGLLVEKRAGGEASGEGDGRSAMAYPSRIVGLSIAGRRFAPFVALASDMTGLSEGYGRPLHAVLGYSFLRRHAVLVDYPNNRLSFIDRRADVGALTRGCGTHWEQPLRLLKGLNWPVISGFHIGAATAPVSLDTGSNAGVALYQSALALPGVRAALTNAGTVEHGGFRGSARISAYTFNAGIGFGPFELPPGQAVTVRSEIGSPSTRVANVGNQVLARMRLKMLVDYPGRRIAFWGSCLPQA